MEPDDFTFHIIPDRAMFCHTKLIELINSVIKDDKIELEKIC